MHEEVRRPGLRGAAQERRRIGGPVLPQPDPREAAERGGVARPRGEDRLEVALRVAEPVRLAVREQVAQLEERLLVRQNVDARLLRDLELGKLDPVEEEPRVADVADELREELLGLEPETPRGTPSARASRSGAAAGSGRAAASAPCFRA
jgi:hypothetical protein